MKRQQKTGFSLIELMVAVTIIGILAVFVVITYNKSQARARDAERVSNITTIAGALEMYKTNSKKYPDFWKSAPYNCSSGDFQFWVNGYRCQSTDGWSTDSGPWQELSNELSTYLSPLPTDPKSGIASPDYPSLQFGYFLLEGKRVYDGSSETKTAGFTLFARPTETVQKTASSCRISYGDLNTPGHYICVTN